MRRKNFYEKLKVSPSWLKMKIIQTENLFITHSGDKFNFFSKNLFMFLSYCLVIIEYQKNNKKKSDLVSLSQGGVLKI